MPTLNWIGKEKVIRHHQDVPFRVLEHQYGFSPEKGEQKEESRSGNMIIHGDNLEALKSLLPYYEGKINCIYIDPPYNTGNESWVYNDNVNHPKIKKWLGQVVGKEGDDLSRHDKWLCMMYPRLKLLQKLLADDGVIFISIDDIEQTFLKLICDEIFGKTKFIGNFIWKSRQNKDNRNINRFSNDHEYIFCYGAILNGEKRKTEQYKNPDNDPRGHWTSANMVGLLPQEQRPNLHYDLINPKTGINYGKPELGWRYDINTMQRLIEEERIIFPKTKKGRPRRKVFLNELNSSVTGFSSVVAENIYTKDGTKEIRDIFSKQIFDFPKPSDLINILINQATEKDSIILDSFAGSGTTAHAVLNLNQQDGGNRKFILIEMENYAQTITAERVKRVMTGYGKDKKAVEGTGGTFDYFTLGPRMFLDNENLNEEIGEERIREYIWYSETRSPFVPPELPQASPYFLGIKNDTAYYFYYRKDNITTLNYEFVENLTDEAGQYLIYADICTLSEDFMKARNILFKKIPRDIKRF